MEKHDRVDNCDTKTKRNTKLATVKLNLFSHHTVQKQTNKKHCSKCEERQLWITAETKSFLSFYGQKLFETKQKKMTVKRSSFFNPKANMDVITEKCWFCLITWLITHCVFKWCWRRPADTCGSFCPELNCVLTLFNSTVQ